MIPADVTPVLDRLLLDRTHWGSTVTDFNRGFHRAAGHWSRLRERAHAIGRHWLQGLRIAHQTYSTTRLLAACVERENRPKTMISRTGFDQILDATALP